MSSPDGMKSRGRGRRGRRGRVPIEEVGEIPAPGGPPPEEGEMPRDAVRTDSPERTDQEQLAKKFENLQITRVSDRPGYGIAGHRIQLNANFFAIEMAQGKGTMVVQQYRVDVSKIFLRQPRVDLPKLKKDEKRQLFWHLVDTNVNIFRKLGTVYDDSETAFTIDQLCFPGGVNKYTFEVELQLEMEDKPRKYSIVFQYCGSHVVDLTLAFTQQHSERSTTSIQIIDLILTQALRCPLWRDSRGWYPFRRGIYPLPGNGPPPISLGGGREVWTGITSAAKVGQDWKPFLNVDVSNSAFIKSMSAIDYMLDLVKAAEFGGSRGIGGPSGSWGGGNGRGGRGGHFGGAGRGLTVNDLLTPEGKLKGHYMSILQKEFEGLKFKTVHLEQNRVKTCKFVEKPAFELQYFKDAIFTRSRENNETAFPATERKQKIDQMIRNANLGNDLFVKEFQLNLNLQMVSMDGRVLDWQNVSYNENVTKPVEDQGKWATQGAKFYQPAVCSGISLITFTNDSPQTQQMLQNFFETLLLTCEAMGMQFPPSQPDCVRYVRNVGELKEAMMSCMQDTEKYCQRQCQLILMVLKKKDQFAYCEVKRLSEIELGVMTQVVLEKTVRSLVGGRSQQILATNIAMKLNMKLGGINSILTVNENWSRFAGAKNATLFLGIDVTHPAPYDLDRVPSIGAVVGNLDFEATKYGASIKIQKRCQEHIIHLFEAAKERILQYLMVTGRQPQRIIVYRDGVAESQFMQVLNEELKNIQSACESLSEGYKPKITYIVVQKRHHTRLFCRNDREAIGRARNVPHGTVVDTTITHPCEFDFYLCSHYGIQGTSRPAHYYVLYDESGFTADELQMLTYQLCHLYGRCARVVSIPAPVYYADLCATRARCHAADLIGTGSASDSSSSAEQSTCSSSERMLRQSVTVHERLQNTMYFS